MKPFSSLFALVATIALAGCGDPVKPAQVAEKEAAKTATGIALPKNPMKGQELKGFFPKNTGDYTLAFTQEKPGFALAELREKSGEQVAALSISDLATNPGALAKFAGATAKVKGFPLVASADASTAILVGNQFEVQVRSQKATEDDRRLLLEEFDLEGLAKKSQAQGTLGQP